MNIQWGSSHTKHYLEHLVHYVALSSEIFSVSAFMTSRKGCCPLTRRTFWQERVEINRSNFVVPTVANTCPDAILGCNAKACGFRGMA